MIPKEYQPFCKMKRSMIYCPYVESTDCPKTCNLAEEYLMKNLIESEERDIIQGLDKIIENGC